MASQERERIAGNLDVVRQRMGAACRRAGRAPEDVLLVAVTKAAPAALIEYANDLGVRDFGENRVQEARGKVAQLGERSLTWHMIGHLQRNKAREAVALFGMIHSVDSVELARQVGQLTAQRDRVMPVLLEVNVSGEESKFGFRVAGEGREAFLAAARQIAGLPGIAVQGLMTVAPAVADAELARPCFRRLRELRDELRGAVPSCAWGHLSMGMSDDYAVAIEEGATIIRVGRAIFGPRPAA
jgi:hypothetical protein